jgi:hypothetical protein
MDSSGRSALKARRTVMALASDAIGSFPVGNSESRTADRNTKARTNATRDFPLAHIRHRYKNR